MNCKKTEQMNNSFWGNLISYWKITLIVSVLIIVLIPIIIYYPEYHINSYYQFLEAKEKMDAISAFRSAILQCIGGAIAIIGIYYTYRRTTASENKNIIDDEANKNNFLLSQYSKASELLKEQDIAAKLSGIYLFEKIMNNNEEYYWQIIELLTAYIREE